MTISRRFNIIRYAKHLNMMKEEEKEKKNLPILKSIYFFQIQKTVRLVVQFRQDKFCWLFFFNVSYKFYVSQ